VFASFTSIGPRLAGITHYSSNAVTWLLALFGAGLSAGNVVAGWLADPTTGEEAFAAPAPGRDDHLQAPPRIGHHSPFPAATQPS
jgi:MFS family permease